MEIPRLFDSLTLSEVRNEEAVHDLDLDGMDKFIEFSNFGFKDDLFHKDH